MSDFSELNDLVADLTKAGLTAGVRVAGAMERSCQRIEEDAKKWAPRKRLPHYAKTITHDVTAGPDRIIGEVGPDKDINGQAKLAGIFEYGTSKLAPRAHLGPALDRESPNLADDVGRIGGDLPPPAPPTKTPGL